MRSENGRISKELRLGSGEGRGGGREKGNMGSHHGKRQRDKCNQPRLQRHNFPRVAVLTDVPATVTSQPTSGHSSSAQSLPVQGVRGVVRSHGLQPLSGRRRGRQGGEGRLVRVVAVGTEQSADGAQGSGVGPSQGVGAERRPRVVAVAPGRSCRRRQTRVKSQSPVGSEGGSLRGGGVSPEVLQQLLGVPEALAAVLATRHPAADVAQPLVSRQRVQRGVQRRQAGHGSGQGRGGGDGRNDGERGPPEPGQGSAGQAGQGLLVGALRASGRRASAGQVRVLQGQLAVGAVRVPTHRHQGRGPGRGPDTGVGHVGRQGRAAGPLQSRGRRLSCSHSREGAEPGVRGQSVVVALHGGVQPGEERQVGVGGGQRVSRRQAGQEGGVGDGGLGQGVERAVVGDGHAGGALGSRRGGRGRVSRQAAAHRGRRRAVVVVTFPGTSAARRTPLAAGACGTDRAIVAVVAVVVAVTAAAEDVVGRRRR